MEIDLPAVLVVLSVAQLVLILAFIMQVLNLRRQLEPLLEKAQQFMGGKDGMPKLSISDALGMALYKVMEGLDFSKLGGRIFGGGPPK